MHSVDIQCIFFLTRVSNKSFSNTCNKMRILMSLMLEPSKHLQKMLLWLYANVCSIVLHLPKESMT